MKRLAAILFPLVIAGGTLWLLFAFMTAGPGGCATALLQGTLVEQDGTLAVETAPPGAVSKVSWPFGYGVGEEDGTLTLTRLFTTVAREGDEISVGGGMAADNVTFAACGPVTPGLTFEESVPQANPSEDAGA